MSKAQHTPGPWAIDPHSDETIAIHAPDGDRHICVLEPRDEDSSDWEDANHEKRRDADAVLISAAPDLLAACELGLSHVTELREAWRTGALGEHDGQGGTRSNRNVEVESAFRAAIAKAQESP